MCARNRRSLVLPQSSLSCDPTLKALVLSTTNLRCVATTGRKRHGSNDGRRPLCKAFQNGRLRSLAPANETLLTRVPFTTVESSQRRPNQCSPTGPRLDRCFRFRGNNKVPKASPRSASVLAEVSIQCRANPERAAIAPLTMLIARERARVFLLPRRPCIDYGENIFDHSDLIDSGDGNEQ